MKLPRFSKLTRRDFTKQGGRLSALGLASQLAPALAASLNAQPNPAQTNPAQPAPAQAAPKVGYAIIGLGRISGHFMAGIQGTGNSKVTALVSGHPDKAAQIAAKYGVPKSSIYTYQNMDSIRDNKAVDAVYIGLPNSMHAEYTIRSAKAGKHVLCEKPMCVSVKEGQGMIDACKAANVMLMIAYRLHYEPTNLLAIKLIRDGAIGKIQSIQSTYGFSCDPADWRLKKSLAGGGPLMDVGIYCLNATRYLTGEEPSEFAAYAYADPNDSRFKEVETSLNWITKFPSGILATCSTTYQAPMDGAFHVIGTQGWIDVNPAFNYDGLHLRAELRKPGQKSPWLDEPNLEKDPIDFLRQADHFSTCIQKNQVPKTPGEEGLKDMKYMQEIYKSAGIKMA